MENDDIWKGLKIMNSPVELWKKHPDIDKIEVSSFGRVRSVKGHYYKIRPIAGGYIKLQFRMNGKYVNKLAHRLVAQTFIPNPNNLPQVNHKDGDKTNNNVDNLEWCTRSYNAKKYREKYGDSQGHPVFAINLTNLKVSRYKSQSEAGRSLGVKQPSINYVINGKIKQTGDYWFVNDDGNAVDIVKSKLHDIGKTGLILAEE